jgi:hypothetical protein
MAFELPTLLYAFDGTWTIDAKTMENTLGKYQYCQ